MLSKIRQSYFLLILLLFLAFVVRLYGFASPIADWHSWRQADTSAVSRNFIKYGFNLFHPTFDDLSNVPSGLDNPQGYRFVEFPLYNLAQAGLYQLFDGFSLEQWGRLVSIIASLASIIFIYFLVKKYSNDTAAFFASFFYAFLPFNIYYSRTILPDISMVAAILGGIYFFDKWLEHNTKSKELASLPALTRGRSRSGQSAKTQREVQIFYVLSIIFTASAILLKPYALFFTIPMISIAFSTWGIGFIKRWQLWMFMFFSVIPLILWRVWMMQFPEGIPANDWLFNGGDIRFKGAYFYWIFADRIGRLILGYWGIGLFILGVLYSTSKKFHESIRSSSTVFFASFLLSSLLYVVIIARGNVQHDYYQILIVPCLVIYLGLGASFLLDTAKDIFSPAVSYMVLLVCLIFSLLFGWYFVRDYYNINNPSIVEAGKEVDRLTPPDAKVIALYNGDTSFLYHTNRQGWASFQNPIEEMIARGATHLVIVNPNESDLELAQRYSILKAEPNYLLVVLQ